MKLSGRYKGMDWKVREDRCNFDLDLAVGITVYDKKHLFRFGYRIPRKEQANADYIWDECIRLIGWMERSILEYITQSRLKRLLIRKFGKKYEEAISYRNKWYLRCK